MLPSNVSCDSRVMGVTNAQQQSPTQGSKPDRLGSLKEVHNGTWHAPSDGIVCQPLRSAATAVTRILEGAGRFAACLSSVAMLPLAHAGPEETGLMLSGTAPSGNGLAQLIQNHPKAAIAVVMTAATATFGTVYGLLRPSMAADSPSAERQISPDPLTILACRNLLSDVQYLRNVQYESSESVSLPDAVDKLEAISIAAADLEVKVRQEVDGGTQKESLKSLRQCIERDLKNEAFKELNDQISSLREGLWRLPDSGRGAMIS